MTTLALTRPHRREAEAVVWVVRSLLMVPFVLMGPELYSYLAGSAEGAANVSTSTADVMGTSSLILFMAMLTITPIHTVTGARAHLVLRRDLGLAMFFSAALDLTLAALTTGDTFKGGLLTRVAGHTFLAAGTLCVVLLIPLALTAGLRAKRWLGPHWKTLHRLTYVVWAGILLHLGLLFGFRRFFLDALLMSLPLAALRLPPVSRWWSAARRRGAHRRLRSVLAVLGLGLLLAGAVPLFIELARVGGGAFVQNPPTD